jgi:hypothetical protein
MMVEFMRQLDRAFGTADAKGLGADINGPGPFRYFSIQENFDGSIQANLHMHGFLSPEIVSGSSFSAAFKKLEVIISDDIQKDKDRSKFDFFERYEPKRQTTIFDFIDDGVLKTFSFR